MLDIYTLGDEILRERCKPVKVFDSALTSLIDAMFVTMAEANGVGLAAPQIGADIRLFVVDVPEWGKGVFINPQIIETSVELSCAEEGCLSVPGLFHDVERPASVVVQAQDVNGKVFTVKAVADGQRPLRREGGDPPLGLDAEPTAEGVEEDPKR